MPPKIFRIDKMLYGGSGAAQTGETSPFVLPGELIEIQTEDKTGAPPDILEPSPDRTEPRCVHFGTCGGCHYQHAAYPAQLRIKTGILHQTLAAVGLIDLPRIAIHAAEPWHYRNRIRLRVGVIVDTVEGALRVGYNRHNASGGDPLLPIAMCPIAAPSLWRAASALLELAKTDDAIQIWLAAAVELELFTNFDETALQLTLFTRTPPPTGFTAFCTAAHRAIPQLTGAGVAILPKKPSRQGRRFEQAKQGPHWGRPGLTYSIDVQSNVIQSIVGQSIASDSKHWVNRGAFFQINRYLVGELVRIATAGRSGALAWDLYAGVGLFSRALNDSFAQAVAVEASKLAAAAVKSKAHRAFAMTTLDFLQAAVVQRERPDLIVMDPPRAGVGAEVCALLARVRAPELVYVSCEPVTLARDLSQLIDSGYKLAELHLVDMFPQTFHMETVAVLRR